ncbi:MAG: glycosyltransferase [archaeon]
MAGFSIKKIGSSFLVKSGITSIYRLFYKNRICILTFHNPNFEEFENQIKFLKQNYNPISLQDLHDFYYSNKKLPKYSVLITFDDGYLNLKTFTDLILKKYDVKALVFLPSGLIGKKEIAWWDIVDFALQNSKADTIEIENEKYKLDKQGLLKLYYNLLINRESDDKKKIISELIKQAGVNLPKQIPEEYCFLSWNDLDKLSYDYGSHTVTHPILININSEEVLNEAVVSKNELEKKLGKEIYSFCYPNGDYNNLVVKQVKKAGYKIAFSTKFGHARKSSNIFTLKRIGINRLDDTNVLALKMSGLLNPIYTWRNYRKKIKVILSTNYYYPQLGGITISVDNLNKMLKENSIDSEVYAFPNFFRIIENKAGFLKGIFHKVFVVLYILFGMLQVAKDRLLLKKVIVHGHSANFCGFYAYISKFLGAKSMFTFHTDVRMSGFDVVEKSAKNLSFFNWVDKLTAVSERLGNDVAKQYGIKIPIKTVYNGVSIELNDKESIKRDENSVLFVGNLIKIKDPITFIEAVNILFKKNKKLTVTIVGIGDMEEEIAAKIEEYKLGKVVKLLGRVEHNEIKKLYLKSKVYVCSSIGEGLPNTIIEAIACGCRVVATDVGGIPEIGVVENKCGTLVTPGDAALFASAIEDELAKKENLTGISKITEKFNWEKVARNYIHIYRDIFNQYVQSESYAELTKDEL